MGKDGYMLKMGCVLIVDSIVVMGGLLLGILIIISYIEFVVGVSVGGCIGLIVIVVVILFFFVLFFVLLVGSVLVFVIVLVLFFVVVLMVLGLVEIDWEDIIVVVLVVVIVLVMLFIYLIVIGIVFGFIFWIVIKVLFGCWCELNLVLVIFFVLFVIKLGFFNV